MENMVYGVIIDTCEKEDMVGGLHLEWDDEYNELPENEQDKYDIIINERLEKLKEKTPNYLYGQDDGKNFIAVYDKKDVQFIRELFPEFFIYMLYKHHYPWNYAGKEI